MSQINKCGHELCNCAVVDNEKFCSDHCREATEQHINEIACDCGCAACK